mmetsp:Transcript_122722/g.238679  ORF Transcript_122722/g.238679 Transcript_122722/m.238679 type:complete len:86 (-) Transcript_122722:1365-1622(-)
MLANQHASNSSSSVMSMVCARNHTESSHCALIFAELRRNKRLQRLQFPWVQDVHGVPSDKAMGLWVPVRLLSIEAPICKIEVMQS